MFYLKEFFLRFKYVCFSFFLTLICFFTYKNFLLLLMSFSLLEDYTENNSDVFGKFIFTHPAELLKVQLFASLFFSVFYSLPYISWTFLEFFKSSFYKNEYKSIKKIVLSVLMFFFIANITINLVLFPNIWTFFENFNTTKTTGGALNFFFELRIEEYTRFLSDFTYLTNFFYYICFNCFHNYKFRGFEFIKLEKTFYIIKYSVCNTFKSTRRL